MNDKILIVDDSSAWREHNSSAVNVLTKSSYEIIQAPSAKKAFEMVMCAKNDPYKVIISDLHMESDFEPELAGEWLVRQIKMLNEYSASHIIIVSSMYNIEHIARKFNVNYVRKSSLATDILPLKLVFESLGIISGNAE